MEERLKLATALREMLLSVEGIADCRLTGSLVSGGYDEYSSIDFLITPAGKASAVSPQVMEVFSKNYSIIYTDHVYIDDHCSMAAAISEQDPFLIVRLKCAIPDKEHESICWTSPRDIFNHLLYLWVNCCKCYLRGKCCMNSLVELAAQIPGIPLAGQSEQELLMLSFHWLRANSDDCHTAYLNCCEELLLNGPRKRRRL